MVLNITSLESQIGIGVREKWQKFVHVIQYLVTVNFEILKMQAKCKRANPFLTKLYT